MKKSILLCLSTVVCLIFSSCDNDVDGWNSETYNYDGRFVVAAVCTEKPSKNAIIEKANEIYIYNTAANVANEIWLDDVSGKFPFKGKFQLNGTSAGFSGKETVSNTKSILFIYNAANEEYVAFTASNADNFPEITAAGQLCTGIQEYTRITLQEGKILPKGATTVGGNISDGIQLSLVLHTDNVRFISSQRPAADWANPAVPEYEWKLQAGSVSTDASKDEHWTITGYRYTGYPEDM